MHAIARLLSPSPTYPQLDAATGVVPRRAFLITNRGIPAGVELTWDYGRRDEPNP